MGLMLSFVHKLPSLTHLCTLHLADCGLDPYVLWHVATHTPSVKELDLASNNLAPDSGESSVHPRRVLIQPHPASDDDEKRLRVMARIAERACSSYPVTEFVRAVAIHPCLSALSIASTCLPPESALELVSPNNGCMGVSLSPSRLTRWLSGTGGFRT